ncbi:Ldh family oxidoreductase [Variovorax sp. GB1P17]|uniref:Ldh family oxidoreductase n=1 Tax=Variovorax sp. GB1P17 TaxID=3443740 RepID=UPI003F453902
MSATHPSTSASPSSDVLVPVAEVTALLHAILVGNGVPAPGAEITAQSLVAAEVEGVSSHGVALLPLYVERLRAGGVVADAVPQIVEDHGGMVVMTASHALGQVSSRLAVDVAVERARVHGVAVVTVRHAFHFGTAAFWSKQFAQQGMVGFAFSNTRPLMPAPGGAQRVVGNNPMSIAFPSASGDALVVDMAMSATAMGRIRLADAKGQAIPEGWATDAQGNATTSAAEAISGMLLPAAGPKGFGLAVAVDLLCGALSGGAFGSAVQPLYGDAAKHYDCSHAFIAIDASRVGHGVGIGPAVSELADEIRNSAKAAGTQTLFAPGDLERLRREQRSTACPLPSQLVDKLNQLAQQAGRNERLAASTH